MGAINPTDKLVEIYINGQQAVNLHMRLGRAGCGYFVDYVESLFSDSDSDLPSAEGFFDSGKPIGRIRSAEDVNGKTLNPHKHPLRVKKPRRDASVSESQSNTEEDVKYYVSSPTSPECLSDSEVGSQSRGMVQVCGDMDSRRFGAISDVGHIVQKDPTVGDSVSKSFQTCQASDQKGVYLEDLVTPSVDENIKRAYLYVRKSNERLNPGQKATDAGSKSDSGNGSCLKLDSSNNLELKISLCGGLPTDGQMDHERFCAHLVTFEEFSKDPAGVIANPNLVLLFDGKFYNWNTVAPMILSRVCFQAELPYGSVLRLEESFMPKKQPRRRAWFTWSTSGPESQPTASTDADKTTAEVPQETRNDHPPSATASLAEECQVPQRRITLTSREVECLGLRPGANNIEFRIVTKYQGTASCLAKIYLWQSDDKVIVSDVDGTITRSDILGHLLPALGRDWTHEGVAELYSRLADNGYKFIYLSARAIGEANLTRGYIDQVCQRGKYHLPGGPILLSPTSLLDAFHLEVIARTPELFKIECLKEVRELFGPDSNPFYAAFGNRINDVKAYIESGFELGRIYTVNPGGELRNERLPCVSKSFNDMVSLADYLFPCISPRLVESDLIEANEEVSFTDYNVPTSDVDMSLFSSFSFWREPIPSETPTPS
ncbi:Phosphatidate phosphatase LPIN2 [Echinococcus granulosus]|uniref:Phosphatidate phosphatase LPIN2 n=1 Tax=Echinococcus granulosus TaxID=6210 RepID=U6JEJ5_ECHGR|nr:Phosphatidate phosphatase LPIN2 [Echinococcus granulosus]EUB60940.1 Phosphatidate phosphatase LPIN2 [Echinococcus granulosus]CDS21776.1 phosphatidate phosphatase LPIN2 [Echinococcus granulosus]